MKMNMTTVLRLPRQARSDVASNLPCPSHPQKTTELNQMPMHGPRLLITARNPRTFATSDLKYRHERLIEIRRIVMIDRSSYRNTRIPNTRPGRTPLITTIVPRHPTKAAIVRLQTHPKLEAEPAHGYRHLLATTAVVEVCRLITSDLISLT